ncbi:MAG: AI-2E family transporter [Oscillospiraceae bacterium]|nr:AI-2E family transporter [Oscillospiraceae bacterium]
MELNKKNILRILALAVGIAVLWWVANNIAMLGELLSAIVGILSPLLLGLAIAYVVNLIMSPLERLWTNLLKNKEPRSAGMKMRRPLCLVISFLLVLGAVFAIFFILVPNLVRTVQDMVAIISDYLVTLEDKYNVLRAFAEQYSIALPELKPVVDPETGMTIGSSLLDKLEHFWNEKGQLVLDTTIGLTTSVVVTIFTSVFNLVMGIAFSIYILAQKERLAHHMKRLFYAAFPQDKVSRFLAFLHRANKSFSSFVQGQVVEAVIIGVLVFIGMSIFRFPFAPVISVLVGVTALIPILGAWIGAIIGALLILPVSFMKAVWFLVFLIILQQLEGNLIYPHVVGRSIGLPGIWVFFAVIIGSGVGGVLGMLLGVPICAIVYNELRAFIHRKDDEKAVAQAEADQTGE